MWKNRQVCRDLHIFPKKTIESAFEFYLRHTFQIFYWAYTRLLINCLVLFYFLFNEPCDVVHVRSKRQGLGPWE